MYKSKEDCKKHCELMDSFVTQQDEFYQKTIKSITLDTLPDMMDAVFFLFQEQHKKLCDLVEDQVITVEQFFFDLSTFQAHLKKDIADFKKWAIKNDPKLSPSQKVAMVTEGFSYDTLEGVNSEMMQKSMTNLLKNSFKFKGSGGLDGLK